MFLLESEPTLTIIDYVSKGGIVVFLLLAIYGGIKRWWVFGWLYKDMVDERNEWRSLALDNQSLVNTTASIGERLIAGGTTQQRKV
jgi:hypothetical protein